ncbi:MAG TPA: ferredoxin [Actinoplanes sp.]|jgi:ferredoxin|nr:ferredoxin [Actinoplanes sp.]
MKVTLDQDACIGSGQCVLTAGDVFDQRPGDGVAVLLRDDLPDDRAGELEEAALICPAQAIRLGDPLDA